MIKEIHERTECSLIHVRCESEICIVRFWKMAGAAELKLKKPYQAKKFPVLLYNYAAYIYSWKENTLRTVAQVWNSVWSSWIP